MDRVKCAMDFLSAETSAIERRLAGVPRFADTLPMVGAAAPSHSAVCLADRVVERSRRLLGHALAEFRGSLGSVEFSEAELRRVRRQYLTLRRQFSLVLSTVDIFADALTQRSEHGIGVVLRGLDRLAEDALRVATPGYDPPPVVCYLDDGVPGGGGAIRRAFTRLPGGETNAVGLIKIPRERLLGLGLASLLHEVGHQGLATLNLVPTYQEILRAEVRRGALDEFCANYWCEKLSELLPDLWALQKLGVTATLGLFAVLGRTPSSTYRDVTGDPHPAPWIRALASASYGARVMPHPLWQSLTSLWLTLYPLEQASAGDRALLEGLLPSLGPMLDALCHARPRALYGATFAESVGSEAHPARLVPLLDQRLRELRRGRNRLGPCLTLATLGLGRQLGCVDPSEEHDLLSVEVRRWARRSSCELHDSCQRGGLDDIEAIRRANGARATRRLAQAV